MSLAPRCFVQNRLSVHFLRVFCLAALLALSGCAQSTADLWANLTAREAGSGFKPLYIPAPPFTLSALLKTPQAGAPEYLVVYIEGDGRVLTSNGGLREDPTPARILVPDLAALDPAPAVLYLARIGQYQPQNTGADYAAYWAGKRLAPEAVRAADKAISTVKAQVGAKRIYIIGYSGGGGMACLVAARRSGLSGDNDVAGLVTVAGLLDHKWWTDTNGYQPLAGSLNPADFALELADLPQIHFYGENDTLISPKMSARFASLAEFKDLRRIPVAAEHGSGWLEAWPDLLREYVVPMR